MFEDSFKLLGLDPDAALNDVKKAYRILAKKHHPDRFTENEQKKKQEEKMVRINEAYQLIISNLNKRKKEDKSQKSDSIKSAIEENDFTIYKKGVEYFNKYSGSFSLKLKDFAYDLDSLLEKKKNIEAAKECFIRVLNEYPDSDWAFDSEERLKKIVKLFPNLEESITFIKTHSLSRTAKGTPIWFKKNSPQQR